MAAGVTLSAPEPLGADHDVERFASGEEGLDIWLKRRALRNQASGASRTFVVCDARIVVAYYALASSAVAIAEAPGRFRRNMPDPIPLVVLGRLERFSPELNRWGFTRHLFSDSRSVLAKEAGMDGPSFIA